MNPTGIDTARAMILHGGEFMKLIGRAWLAGDAENRTKIEQGWIDDWARYAAWARHDSEAQAWEKERG